MAKQAKAVIKGKRNDTLRKVAGLTYEFCTTTVNEANERMAEIFQLVINDPAVAGAGVRSAGKKLRKGSAQHAHHAAPRPS